MRGLGKKERHQKKGRLIRIHLRNENGDSLFRDAMDQLMVPEDRVLALSVLYFDDPEPCFIHRGAVLSRVYGEIEMALPNEEWVAMNDLDAEIQKHLSHYRACEIRAERPL